MLHHSNQAFGLSEPHELAAALQKTQVNFLLILRLELVLALHGVDLMAPFCSGSLEVAECVPRNSSLLYPLQHLVQSQRMVSVEG